MKDPRSSQSAQFSFREYKILEINRSLCLYFAIVKFLGVVAVLILLSTNNDLSSKWLQTNPEVTQKLESIARSVSYSISGDLVPVSLSTIFGIYGFAVLNQHFIFFYNTHLVIQIIIRCTNHVRGIYHTSEAYMDVENFQDYATNNRTRKIVNTIQKIEKCCGTHNYQFEDLAALPETCCPKLNQSEACTKERKYENICDTLEGAATEVSNLYVFWSRLMLGSLFFYVIEIALCTHISYRLNVHDSWKLQDTRSRK